MLQVTTEVKSRRRARLEEHLTGCKPLETRAPEDDNPPRTEAEDPAVRRREVQVEHNSLTPRVESARVSNP